MESSCCVVARKLGGKKCPVCRKPIRLALVLRLLRTDARAWWYHEQLRKWGDIEEARKRERASIRSTVRFIRKNIGRHAVTHRVDCIEFPDREMAFRPFDLKPLGPGGMEFSEHTSCLSGCHPGTFTAWVYCYAHRIGLKYRAKVSDLV